MNKRREIFEDCIDYLFKLFEWRVKKLNKQNLTDINIYSEYFFCNLFNLIIPNSKFRNLNEEKQNVESIDLIDDVNKKIIQVSATVSKKKIEKTLNNNIIKIYTKKGYELKFAFIKSNCKYFKNKDYNNPHKISFDSEKNIISLDDIQGMIFNLNDYNKLEQVRDLFKKEFENQKKVEFSPSELSQIVFILYEKNSLNKLDDNFDLNQFKIQSKIQFNDLEKIKDVYINPNAVYFGYIEKIYQQFDQQGHDKRLAIYSKLTEFYYQQTKNLEIDNVEKFENIIKSVKNQVLDSSNYPKEISVERLELYCKIIVVHAFIECKIFEKPEKRNTIVLYLEEEEECYEN